MQEFEKLGVFYLGRPYDLQRKQAGDGLLLYESKDLVTHAVCIGMTGSGKTGLCLDLLEEAAIDGIPVIAIDPKGDISNLLLTFPDLKAADFLPWISADDARRAGVPLEEYAQQQAQNWGKGLPDWGQDGDRIRRLKDAADFAIYTPGSSAGLQVSILKSFDTPPAAVLNDDDALRERINSTASSILTLLDVDADPLKSREHILLSTILNHCWKAGQSLDLPGLIHKIQSPPVTQIGALSLESFYPAKDRFALAMSLNNLLAAPGFDSWMKGSPLDIDQILYLPDGKPRVSIFSIAHLSDTERMFFVSLLLSQVLSWMRGQSGTTSLRAILYMDEIFGYFPPTANPPSKQPLLTLLKQARAFGLGIVLATQNPVDLDYKGLSNTGTWFVGRLQTERDKARLLDGLEGVSAGTGARFDRQSMASLLAGLGSRIFLMNNVHEDAPIVFQSRWSMSYLRGPLSRDEIKRLMSVVPESAGASQTAAAAAANPAPALASVPAVPAATVQSGRPLVPPDVTEYFLPVVKPGSGLVYRPMILGSAMVRFTDTRRGVDVNRKLSALVRIDEGNPMPVTWQKSTRTSLDIQKLEKEPQSKASFQELPAPATVAKNYPSWSKDFAAWLAATKGLEIFQSPATGETSHPGESERDFRIRLQQLAREQRDEAAAKLRSKYAPRISVLQERLLKAQAEQEEQADRARQSQMDAAIDVGATLLGSFMGRRGMSSSTINKASSAARRAGRAMQQGQGAARIEDRIDALNQQLNELESEFKGEMSALEARYNPANEKLESILIKAKKTNISVLLLSLVWVPEFTSQDGQPIPVWS